MVADRFCSSACKTAVYALLERNAVISNAMYAQVLLLVKVKRTGRAAARLTTFGSGTPQPAGALPAEFELVP